MSSGYIVKLELPRVRGWTVWHQDGDADRVIIRGGRALLWPTRSALLLDQSRRPVSETLIAPTRNSYRWRYVSQDVTRHLERSEWRWRPAVRARVLDTCNMLLDVRFSLAAAGAPVPEGSDDELATFLDTLTFAYGPTASAIDRLGKDLVRSSFARLVQDIEAHALMVHADDVAITRAARDAPDPPVVDEE